MKISKIQIFPVKGNSKLKAKANVTLISENGWEQTIKGFRVHDDGQKDPWVGVPTEKYLKNGKSEYSEIIWLNQTAISNLYPQIISEYRNKSSNVV